MTKPLSGSVRASAVRRLRFGTPDALPIPPPPQKFVEKVRPLPRPFVYAGSAVVSRRRFNCFLVFRLLSVCILAGLILATATNALRADVMAEQDLRYRKLPAGIEVSPERALEGMALALGRTDRAGFAELVNAPGGPGFDKAMRLVTRRVPAKPSDFQASAKSIGAVKRNDVMLAVFWARSALGSDEAEGAFVLEQTGKPEVRSAYYRFECTREWRRFFVPFLANQDFAVGKATLCLHAGYGPQVMEIGGLRLAAYGRAVAFGDLPFTPLNYKGRADNAPWRIEATAAIEKGRRAQLTIVVRNSKGRIRPWTEVRIRQRQHTYEFGSTLAAGPLLEESPEGDVYRTTFLENFNRAVLDPRLATPNFQRDQTAALDQAGWLLDNETPPQSHGLLWLDPHLPPELAELREKPEALRPKVLAEVRAKVTATKGQVAAWSAPVGLAARGELGSALLAEVYRVAHEADPRARLVVHAGNVLGGTLDKTLIDRSHAQIRSLLDARAPLQAIALGSRFEDQLVSPERVWDILDRFAEFHLPLLIADHEIDSWDEEAQADYTRDLLTAAFAHQATAGFFVSGFWAGEHPVPNAAFFAPDWTPRSHAKAWQDLVYKKWWTQTTISTNGKGMAKVKAYLGDYAIDVRADGKTKTIYAKLGKNGRWLEISL